MNRDDWHAIGWCTIAAVAIIIVAWLFVPGLASAAAAARCHGQVGTASWYGPESGNRTASGERFNGSGMTAAHRSLPLGTIVRVTDLRTGRSVVVRINDRGPARWTGRIIDLSRAAAIRLGMITRGTAEVCIEPG